MIKVHNIIDILEIDGVEVKEPSSFQIVSHDNQRRLVVIAIGDKKLTVSAEEINLAVSNAQNTKR